MGVLSFFEAFLYFHGSHGGLFFIVPATSTDGAAEAFSFILGVRYGDQGAAFFAVELEDGAFGDFFVGVFPVGFFAFLATEAHAEVFVVFHLHEDAAPPAVEFADDGLFFFYFRFFIFSLAVGFALTGGAAVSLPGTVRGEFFVTDQAFHDGSLLRQQVSFAISHWL